MADKHRVRFEPVGVEIEVDEDQNILRAAAEQGVMLMHGCKEGQCGSCKSFILDGDDVEHDRYSTFALPDFEKEDGFTLLCRAHAYEDLTIELLNYDEEMIRSGLPIQEAVVEVVANDNVTHDMRHLVVRLVEPGELKFFPGQYVDFTIPGTEESRSFSMANTSSREGGLLEFVIKVYPDGRFSEFLDTQVAVGDRLDITGPFGVFTLRDAPDTELIFVGGGAGMAPILSLLRCMAERGIDRKATYYYGARTRRDLCFDEELRELEQTLPNFRYVPALSEPDDDDWDGEVGLITDVVRQREQNLSGVHGYVCGPPPMVEAALELLPELGIAEDAIFYDKFTTTGDPED
ncbi:NADH:ubiquinone reductase (Na(+)-transporting) subunit F [Haloechinothrix halophila]|uniref:NADH:ubiquinone reductase (Na(+)-transporting) subunit F n=1 Tax=Haloechinothrix halophila TaxID=1069073 RepID=UPI000414ED6D|nr:2Fe-2S iron-sulfur cluster binding domain-containing protein [Haloechinothrix halophila]